MPKCERNLARPSLSKGDFIQSSHSKHFPRHNLNICYATKSHLTPTKHCLAFFFLFFAKKKKKYRSREKNTQFIHSANLRVPLIFPLHFHFATCNSFFLFVANFPALSLLQQHSAFHLHSCCEAGPSAKPHGLNQLSAGDTRCGFCAMQIEEIFFFFFFYSAGAN